MTDVRETNAAEASPGRRGPDSRAPRDHSFDAALGARIRALRVAVGMSQTVLGQATGVSFQQIQKYELGKDRIAVGTLKAISDALAVHPGTFFEGDMPMPTGSRHEQRAAMNAAAILQRIRDPRILKRLLELAKVLGDAADGGEGA